MPTMPFPPLSAGNLATTMSFSTGLGNQYLYIRDTDNNIQQIYYSPSSNTRSNPMFVAGGATGNPVSLVTPNGQRHIFYRGIFQGVNDALCHVYFQPGSDTPIGPESWDSNSDGHSMTGDPATMLSSDGQQQHIFYRKSDGNIYQVYYDAAKSKLSNREQWVTNQSAAGNPAALLSPNGQQHMFFRGTDNKIYHVYFDPASTKRNGPEQWPPNAASSFDAAGDPVTLDSRNGQQHIFYRGVDNNIYHVYYDPTNGIVGPESWASNASGNPATLLSPNGQQHVFYRGSDGSLNQVYYDPASNTRKPEKWVNSDVVSDPATFLSVYSISLAPIPLPILPLPFPIFPPLAFSQQHVFYRVTDGTINQVYYDSRSNQRTGPEAWWSPPPLYFTSIIPGQNFVNSRANQDDVIQLQAINTVTKVTLSVTQFTSQGPEKNDSFTVQPSGTPGLFTATGKFLHAGAAQLEGTGTRVVGPVSTGVINVNVQSAPTISIVDPSYWGPDPASPGSFHWVSLTGTNQVAVPPGGIWVTFGVWADAATKAYTQYIRFSIDGGLSWQDGGFASSTGLGTVAILLTGEAPKSYALSVQACDWFSQWQAPVTTNFQTIDTTGPTIAPPTTIPAYTAPGVFVLPNLKQPIIFSGTVADAQTGVGSLSYSFNGQSGAISITGPNGQWQLPVNVSSFGTYTLTLIATDKAAKANTTELSVRFEVRSSYKPETIDELLSPRAYLEELERFVTTHTTIDNTSSVLVSPDMLKTSFDQHFDTLWQIGEPGADVPVNDLLAPVRLLRKESSLESAGLIARYSFEEARGGATVLKDRGGRFGLDGTYVGGAVTPTDPALDGAVIIDATHYAVVSQNTALLEVGKNDADFTVAFWIYLQARPAGAYTAIMFKGDPTESQGGTIDRTFALWLNPNDNTVYFRIHAGGYPDFGGTSNSSLTYNCWTHLAYVKEGGCLRLYVDGRIDIEMPLPGPVVSNTHELRIGRGPNAGQGTDIGFTGALDELRIYALALDSADIKQLALDRRAVLPETPVSDYHQFAYEALLSGLGTSFEEIRTLRSMTATQRESLAKRVGLWIGDKGDLDRLDYLLPPAIADATADFQALKNPGDVWSYGYSALATDNYPVVLFDRTSTLPPGTNLPPNAWTRADYNLLDPTIWKNTTLSDAYGRVGPGKLSMHPGPKANSDFALLRFTAPATYTYVVTGQFFAGDIGAMSGSILLNGKIAPLVHFANTTDQSTFALPPITLSKGQTLDFVVGNNGDYAFGNTPITVTVTPNEGLGTVGYERWLADTFGLPLTIPDDIQLPTRASPILLNQAQIALVRQWQRDDAARLVPDLDPDLVEVDDLSTSATTWVNTLRARQAEVSDKFQTYLAGSPADAFADVYSAADQASLVALQESDAAGENIDSQLEAFCLDRTAFRRLLGYAGLIAAATPFSAHERDDFAHLLVQAWKRRKRYAGWIGEERAIWPQRLWPNHLPDDAAPPLDAAWVPGNFKSTFLPWRASAQARADLEARLNERCRAWQDLIDNQAQVVAVAQRTSLPVLRDGLLGLADLPDAGRKTDRIAERWLMDFSSSGATQLTPIEQATASLQTLVNGVRGRWFDVGHPANGWTVLDTIANPFDAQWRWLESYGQWQAAVSNFLYPENVLYPELRSDNSTQLSDFLNALGKLQPLSTAALNDPNFTKARNIVIGTAEQYFVHVATGLAFQRAGLYTAALDQYRNVYDSSQPTSDTRKLDPLKSKSEPDPLPIPPNPPHPPIANFSDYPNWTQNLLDPHHIASLKLSGSCNPYTRFTLFQILRCILGQADDAYASGTRDGRSEALGLYLEARDILNFPELIDLQPTKGGEAYLPSQVLAAFRAHTDSALRKLRSGLSYLGTPLPPDLTRGKGGGALSSLVRPTPYRYRVLIDRAKQLTAQAQQLEAQYLSAIERGDAETEKYLSSGFAVDAAQQTVSLRGLQQTEAGDGKALAIEQQARSRIQKDRYIDWLAAGQTANEKAQIDNLWAANRAKDVVAGIDAAITTLNAATAAASLSDLIFSGGAKAVIATSIGVAAVSRAVTQGLLNDNETRAQVSGILASQERRTQEWQLQADLAAQDIKIGQQQIVLAQDRFQIATQELTIANSQLANARQMLAFLKDKFTSAKFYQWFIGELAQIYATFLRLATATAQHAELQLAFERQEQPARLIKADYWIAAANAAASSSNSTGNTIDPRGITGSTRLLQDLYTLDNQAFTSERRLLNLTQTFSLARLMPVEFEEFRRTGLLAFATPMQWFDEGFPGHYMRLIKKVRVSVAALIPPSIGIRATLANGGLSRVVTADPGFPTMVIRQDPQMVALTSPAASTGVFELDTQSDLLYPFEGTGVDTTWYLELPPAGNPFDFNSLMDVVLGIEYTAQFSSDVRDRVVKQLPRLFSGDRVYSVKRDFPDTWYELANGTAASVTVTIPVSPSSFPPGLTQPTVTEVSVSARALDGSDCAFTAQLSISQAGSAARTSDPAPSIKGIASSRQSGGSSWHTRHDANNLTYPVLDNLTLTSAGAQFALLLSTQTSSSPDAPPPFVKQLRDSQVDDIIIVLALSGTRPAWT